MYQDVMMHHSMQVEWKISQTYLSSTSSCSCWSFWSSDKEIKFNWTEKTFWDVLKQLKWFDYIQDDFWAYILILTECSITDKRWSAWCLCKVNDQIKHCL